MAALLVPAIIGQHGSDDLGTTLQIISWLVIATLAIAGLLLFLVPDDQPTSLSATQVWDAIRLVIAPSPFRQLLTSLLFNSTANAIPATLFLFYVSYLLGAPEKAGPLLFAKHGTQLPGARRRYPPPGGRKIRGRGPAAARHLPA